MSSFENRILAALPPAEYESISADLEVVALPHGQLLHEAGHSVSYVYFPDSGVISMLAVLEDGSTLEVSLIGHEGAVGIWSLGSDDPSPWRSVAQIPGTARAMRLQAFHRHIRQHPVFLELLIRFSNTLLQFTAQTAACNRFHSLDQRLARWLLAVDDRNENEDLKLTHEFLAEMLGVHRPSVTVTLGTLQSAGLIEHLGRGRVKVVNREGLEDAACECYRALRRSIDTLLPAQ